MEQVAIWQRLAERWRAAADEVAKLTLKRCYMERAASYERLTAREDKSRRFPAAQLWDS